ncbi:MAG: hypothetical protein M1832_003306 [Thelocarpon impressellum]|nr:MAG: hypothetical protein M1832_003306 [Thelocarpon impressellum]
MKFCSGAGAVALVAAVARAQSPKLDQVNPSLANTSLQTEATDNGVKVNTTASLRAGPRGYVLLEDTAARKKIFHLDHERQPERLVHALGHGAYGTFESSGDWSNLTAACWLQAGAKSDAFTRFSVVVAGTGGSDAGRDTHGFATKIYSECGNQDLVGNHLPSFFINDGILFPDLVHAVKAEPDKGFPTGGTAHTTAFDFFNQRPEGAFQLMNVLSDLGIPRDVRHVAGAGVHTFRMLNARGESTLFKWYWAPALGHRALVYDEATKIAGKNNNFQRVDLYNAIEGGLYPEWELQVQTFPDDGSYMFQGVDLLDPTKIVPFEMKAPLTLGRLTLNRNPSNFFAETEQINFSPANVVPGISFVPDPLLQWRLVSYDDTQNHRHGSPNSYLLPINRPLSPVDNNFRDGAMQPLVHTGASASTPNNIGGVVGASAAEALPFLAESVNGTVGRYPDIATDSFGQARDFWYSLSPSARQHTVDAYRFELGHVAPTVAAAYVADTLARIDTCLARRVAFGIGAPLPPLDSGPREPANATTYPSLYPLAASALKPRLDGLVVALLASDEHLSAADFSALTAAFGAEKVLFEVVAPRQGNLTTGVSANQSYITTASIFYDAVIVGGATGNTTTVPPAAQEFLREALGHAKPLGALGGGTPPAFEALGIAPDAAQGLFAGGEAGAVASAVLGGLKSPGRYFERAGQGLDDVGICT